MPQSDHRALRQEVAELPWYHSIDLGDGIVTAGRAPLSYWMTQANAFFGNSLEGKTVLDIGCYDGFFSFEARRRGAKRVLATDYFVWQKDPRRRRSFAIARERVAPDLETLETNIEGLTPARVGIFDIVLLTGVLYHLRHPLQTLEHVAPLVGELLILETHLDAAESERPAMTFYAGAELNNDPTNWWGPNRACVEAMLQDVGFPVVSYQHIGDPSRGIFHARRNQFSANSTAPSERSGP
jgi:tRNA (mo5U34)-methyltransferase